MQVGVIVIISYFVNFITFQRVVILPHVQKKVDVKVSNIFYNFNLIKTFIDYIIKNLNIFG